VLIVKSAVKKFALGAVARLRPALVDKLTRVGGDIYEGCEDRVRSYLESVVLSHPSVGKTISTGRKKERRTWDE
jgi:hypothetical protein